MDILDANNPAVEDPGRIVGNSIHGHSCHVRTTIDSKLRLASIDHTDSTHLAIFSINPSNTRNALLSWLEFAQAKSQLKTKCSVSSGSISRYGDHPCLASLSPRPASRTVHAFFPPAASRTTNAQSGDMGNETAAMLVSAKMVNHAFWQLFTARLM